MSAQPMDRETVERVAAWFETLPDVPIAQGRYLPAPYFSAVMRGRARDLGPRSISHWGMFPND